MRLLSDSAKVRVAIRRAGFVRISVIAQHRCCPSISMHSCLHRHSFCGPRIAPVLVRSYRKIGNLVVLVISISSPWSVQPHLRHVKLAAESSDDSHSSRPLQRLQNRRTRPVSPLTQRRVIAIAKSGTCEKKFVADIFSGNCLGAASHRQRLASWSSVSVGGREGR